MIVLLVLAVVGLQSVLLVLLCKLLYSQLLNCLHSVCLVGKANYCLFLDVAPVVESNLLFEGQKVLKFLTICFDF